jgi:hypothetical protein
VVRGGGDDPPGQRPIRMGKDDPVAVEVEDPHAPARAHDADQLRDRPFPPRQVRKRRNGQDHVDAPPGKGSACPSPTPSSTEPATRSRSSSSAATASRPGLGSSPTTRPSGPTSRATARVTAPLPQPTSTTRVPAAGQHPSDRGRAHHCQHGGEDGSVGKLGQVGPAGLARQVVHPGDPWDGEHGQRQQRPRRHTRPPVRPSESGGTGHWHRRCCPPRTTGTGILPASRITCQRGRPASR